MRKTLILSLLLLCSVAANAQFKQIAESPSFEEPREGQAKILLMKNGNTAFIHVGRETKKSKRAINVHLYDEAHQEIASTNLDPDSIEIEHAGINSIFDINGNIVLMMQEVISKTPLLYRLIIDGKTGNLKEQKKIGELGSISFWKSSAMAFGNVPVPGFYTRKDPASDNYAVVLFNTFEPDRNKRMEIAVFGPDNKQVNRAYYLSPEDKYKYLQFIDMAILGADKACVLAYGYNTKNSGGKESELILANLDKGAKSVNFTELNFSKDLFVSSGLTRYNPATKSLILLANTKENPKDEGYAPVLAFVNPYDRKIDAVKEIAPPERLNEYSKKGFRGLPQDLFVNDDGSFTVISEEMTDYSGSRSSAPTTLIGDMAIVKYSKTGEPINDFLIRKSHSIYGHTLSPFYHAERSWSAQSLDNGNQYKIFAYLNGVNKNYVLFNDTKRNNDNQEKGSLVTIQGVSGTDGFYYTLTGNDAILKRDYVFGEPEGKKEHNLAIFSISDYDRKNNIYAVLKLENDHGKEVKIVWLQP